jgi:hypothetical protein
MSDGDISGTPEDLQGRTCSVGRTSTAMIYADPEYFAQLEAQVVAVWRQFRNDVSPADTSLLRPEILRLLWLHWRDHEETTGYWQDGLEIEHFELVGDRSVLATGAIWCADERRMWRVPAQFVFELAHASDSLESATVRVGDANLGDLRNHDGETRVPPPSRWLIEFVLERGQPTRVAPEPLVLELRRWLDENVSGKLVRHDWSDLSGKEAEHLLRRQAAVGRLCRLERTWLDGGPAMRIFPDDD